ncbi:MAG: hypothetical protein ACOYEO_02855 [bacterium]
MVAKNLRVVAQKPFTVTWQLPGFSGSKIVACGADIAALHCWQLAAGRMLVFGKVELTTCYESKEGRGKFHFASTTRYVSVEVDLEHATDVDLIKADLAQMPVCTLTGGQEQKAEVEVTGVIQLEIPAVPSQQEKVLPPKEEPMQFFLENETLPPVERFPAEPTMSPPPDMVESTPSMHRRMPFFPRGAESIPPMTWAMPERG